MKSTESVTVIGRRLYDMLEDKNSEDFDQFNTKKVISSNKIKYN